ncbi:hypothetical protein, partial [Pseudomonas aeruginosa]
QARFERIAVVALDVERIVSPRAALGGCRAGKNPARKKFDSRTHLSPSRRRALSQNFVKTPVVVKPYRQAAPLLGLARESRISFCEKR